MESRMAHNHSPVCRPLVMGSCVYNLFFNGHMESRMDCNHPSVFSFGSCSISYNNLVGGVICDFVDW